MKSALASCYCLDQSPGAAFYGGLSIQLTRRTDTSGSITVLPKDRLTDELLSIEDIGDCCDEAKRGVIEAANEDNVDLSRFDVIISDFAYHSVDSRPKCFRAAAKSAFRSAWDAWTRFPVSG